MLGYRYFIRGLQVFGVYLMGKNLFYFILSEIERFYFYIDGAGL